MTDLSNLIGSLHISMNYSHDLQNSDFHGQNLESKNFDRADLRKANFYKAHLNFANFHLANLEEADLSSTELKGASLSHAKLYKASLSLSELQDAYMCSADLRVVNLHAADLTRALLMQAKLQGACLRRAKLKDANLDGADLTNAQFIDEGSFRSSDFDEALNYWHEQIHNHRNEHLLRQAIAQDIINCLNKLPIENKVDILIKAINHPIFQHRDFTKLKQTVNTLITKFSCLYDASQHTKPFIQSDSQALLTTYLETLLNPEESKQNNDVPVKALYA